VLFVSSLVDLTMTAYYRGSWGEGPSSSIPTPSVSGDNTPSEPQHHDHHQGKLCIEAETARGVILQKSEGVGVFGAEAGGTCADDTTPPKRHLSLWPFAMREEGVDEEVVVDMPTPFPPTTEHPECPDHLITLAAENIGDGCELPPMALMKNLWLCKLEDAALERALQVSYTSSRIWCLIGVATVWGGIYLLGLLLKLLNLIPNVDFALPVLLIAAIGLVLLLIGFSIYKYREYLAYRHNLVYWIAVSCALLCAALSLSFGGSHLHRPRAPSPTNAPLLLFTVMCIAVPMLISTLGLPFVANFLFALLVCTIVVTSPHLDVATMVAYVIVCGLALAVSYLVLHRARSSFAAQVAARHMKLKMQKAEIRYRVAAKGINDARKVSQDSIVVGDTYHEVVELPDVVCGFASWVGAHNVIVLIDQNMEYPEGSVYGSELIAQMRRKGFVGLAAIRSANDSPKDEELYLDAGADGVVSKGLKKADAVKKIVQLYHERPYVKQCAIAIQSALRSVNAERHHQLLHQPQLQ